jgi:uncharacterized NAD(P)/FAD-binding protein YdhS
MTWAATIAAITSIVAAVLAYLSAQRAAREARSVTTLNHKIAALDRQAEQLRQDFRELWQSDAQNIDRYVMATCEQLSANPHANRTLSEAAVTLADLMRTGQDRTGVVETSLEDHVQIAKSEIRSGFRESIREIEEERSELLSS